MDEGHENNAANLNEAEKTLEDVIYGENEDKNDEPTWIDPNYLKKPSQEFVDVLRKQVLAHIRRFVNLLWHSLSKFEVYI